MTDDDPPLPEGIGPKDPPVRFGPTIVVPSSRAPAPSSACGPLTPTMLTVVTTGLPSTARPKAARQTDRVGIRRPVSLKATTIMGVEPRRLNVDLSDIRTFAPASSPTISDRTLRILRSVVLDNIKDRDAILWGQRLQEDYGALVSQGLNLSGSDVLHKSGDYLDRMTEILGSIDLQAISGIAPSSSIIDRFMNRMSGRIETVEAFDAGRVEIEQLIVLLGAALDGLLSLKDELEKLSRETEKVGNEIEAMSLAAEYLSSALREERPGLSQRLLERSMNLTQTAAQIRSGTAMRAAQVEHPLRLVSAIQDVVLVAVPGWLGSAAALSTVRDRNRRPTPTQAGELAHQLQTILQRLEK